MVSLPINNVVVYGGSGFLGSHVADALSDAGCNVRIFDCQVSPYLRSDQSMCLGDLMDLDAVVKAAEGCQYIYNFAGLADIDEAKNKPIDTVSLNVLGNIHALEAARLVNARRFIYASTVYVYSNAGSFYRASKQSAERFIEVYNERYGLNYTILRYGSLYGRRADKRNGLYRIVRQALVNKKIIYEGSPNSLREYIHVQDAARLTAHILKPEYANRHIIITGQERMAVKDVIKMIVEMLPNIETKTEFLNSSLDGHYEMTPYSFNPKVGNKLVSNDYVDIGQGLLDCIAELYEDLHLTQETTDDLIVGAHELQI